MSSSLWVQSLNILSSFSLALVLVCNIILNRNLFNNIFKSVFAPHMPVCLSLLFSDSSSPVSLILQSSLCPFMRVMITAIGSVKEMITSYVSYKISAAEPVDLKTDRLKLSWIINTLHYAWCNPEICSTLWENK